MSTGLMQLDGVRQLAGWQWMFLAEAVPSVLLGLVVLGFVTDRPAQAHWLENEERAWLIATIEDERRLIEAQRKVTLWESFWDPKVLLLALNYFGVVTASLGLLLFLPQIIKLLGFTTMQIGLVTMIPYFCGSVSMVLWGYLSDRSGERRFNLLGACTVAAIGLVVAGFFAGSYWSLVGMSLAAIGLYGSKGPFWSMPSMFLTGSASAAGIAWINSIGNIGGWIGPYAVGWVKDTTGSFSGGLYLLAGCAFVAAVVAAFFLEIPRAVPAREMAKVAAE
jgi:ACS family tartrate transporter-like MFS transporter